MSAFVAGSVIERLEFIWNPVVLATPLICVPQLSLGNAPRRGCNGLRCGCLINLAFIFEVFGPNEIFVQS